MIKIIDDSNLFPVLLGIDWSFENLEIINIKKKQMTFEGHNIRVIIPLDPSSGPRYTKPISVEDEVREIDDFYKMTTTQDDYINPTIDGMLSWNYDSACTSDFEEGLVLATLGKTRVQNYFAATNPWITGPLGNRLRNSLKCYLK